MTSHLIAQSLAAQAAQPQGGGGSWLLPLMLVAFVLLLWLPMRRQKKAMAQMKQKQATMGPGTEVMTSFGLYGTVVEIDRDANKAVLEVAPGTAVTVHLQALTTVVEEEAPAGDEVPAEGTAPETAGGLPAGTGPLEAPSAEDRRGSSAAGPDGETPREPGQRTD
ncbi:preprotein translocase subunit YajC [Kocuria flava]|uniref:preprotein translocase subunit YajC n=1 Tax=Kocuria flava TaxID=446860 RepID=UPI003F1D7964